VQTVNNFVNNQSPDYKIIHLVAYKEKKNTKHLLGHQTKMTKKTGSLAEMHVFLCSRDELNWKVTN
jgi:hypothetical protein